jgi:hypothetical protein
MEATAKKCNADCVEGFFSVAFLKIVKFDKIDTFVNESDGKKTVKKYNTDCEEEFFSVAFLKIVKFDKLTHLAMKVTVKRVSRSITQIVKRNFSLLHFC